MDFYADVGCILAIDVQCEACKMKIHEVLRGVAGVYSVEIDSDEGLAKVTGEMDPNIVLAALARNGDHAKLKWMKMTSPAPPPPPPLRSQGYHHHHGGGRHGYHPPLRTTNDYLPTYNTTNYGYHDTSYYNPGYNYGYNSGYINY